MNRYNLNLPSSACIKIITCLFLTLIISIQSNAQLTWDSIYTNNPTSINTIDHCGM